MTTSAYRTLGFLALAIALAGATLGTGPIAARQPPGRHLVVISDLHLGVGKTGGAWNVMEDFRWTAEFAAFLDDVHLRAKGAADLVIAGDTFELWQSLITDCADPNPDRGCTEAEALSRLARIVGEHGAELQALGAFARKGTNRVVFVPGNHDAALLFPRVAAAAVGATGDGTRVSVESRGYWLSADKSVLVEHGHQIGQEVNRYSAWPRPFVGTNPQHLERPWGEQFVQLFYNQYEAKYPIIDNVSEESVGIRYAKEIEGWTGISRGLGKFLYFYLAKLSLAQRVASLGEGKEPVWDIEAIRKQGGQFLVDSLPSDDPVGRAARQPATQLPPSLAEITDAELVAICDARAQIAAYQKEHALPATVTHCPVKDGTMGAIGQAILQRSRATLFAAHLGERFQELEASKQITFPFTLFVYGHTHLADAGFRPLAKSHPDWDPLVVNTGAWQRTVTPAQLEALRCRTTAGQSLIELSPNELPACYNVVWIDPAPVAAGPKAGARTAKTRYWTKGVAGTWSLEDTCRWVSPC